MKELQNLHTHTKYCDGINTPEEMIKIAIEKGFTSLGFSGHSYMHYSPEHSMSIEGTEEYKKEIALLKEKYNGEFDVFLGLEFDMYSKIDMSGYEYMIGSLHYLKIGSEYVPFDRGADEVQSVIDNYFGGDGMAFSKEYFNEFAELPKYGNFDIIGHIDIHTKNIEKVPFFDVESKEYLDSVITCLDAFKGKIPFFEVNTGAISRGYRTTPYPTVNILKELKRMGFGAIISSDCHDAKYLDMAFDDAKELLLSCGFNSQFILTNDGFKEISL